MKSRLGFVSNSSSTSFIIRNKSDRDLSLVDFVKENPQLIQEWNSQYSYDETQEKLIRSAEMHDFIFPSNSSYDYTFGDEDGTLIGRVFDYILRDGGVSENFEWRFDKYYR